MHRRPRVCVGDYYSEDQFTSCSSRHIKVIANSEPKRLVGPLCILDRMNEVRKIQKRHWLDSNPQALCSQRIAPPLGHTLSVGQTIQHTRSKKDQSHYCVTIHF